MSGLSHYKSGALGDGGVEITKGSGLTPIQVEIASGETSTDVPIWLATGLAANYYSDVVVDPSDIEGSDESTWVSLADDDGSGDPDTYGLPGASLSLANVGPGSGTSAQRKHFLKVSVPSGTTAQIKVDIKLRVTATKRATS